jgi:hypothetical protein
MIRITKIKLKFWSENSPSEELGNPLPEKKELKLLRSKDLSLTLELETKKS